MAHWSKIRAMKVTNLMQKKIFFVTTETPVSNVSQMIFGQGINGLPVLKNKKLVGFITERDILSKFYPTIEEYMEDPVHMGNFEEMETKIDEILNLKASDIMSKDPISVRPDTPILKAQSLMFVKKIGRLPVVDEAGKLIGILTKGDIFKAVVGDRLPFEKEKEFFDWMAVHYDSFIKWDERLAAEIPELTKLLKKHGVKKVLDIGSSTGEHSIALAKQGFECFGVDASRLMHRRAERKKKELKNDIKKRLNFFYGTYQDIVHKLPKDIDCALFMGNALEHVLETDKKIIEDVISVMREEKGILIFQILNLKKVLTESNGFRNFTLRKETEETGPVKEKAFCTFYSKNKDVMVVRTVFEKTNDRWFFRGIHSKSVANIDKEKITKKLKSLGFKTIQVYGSNKGEPLLKNSFNEKESDWLNIVAIK